ncbi:hypothetical protein A0H81_04126 [Grifola frondosa]|uniref:Uncharacterized protein n=1 Tax=Grifola frondosa TaxID=5627 RepID=A0A1C7MK79_GRIFR|nr:hypothetical protein A0H81_04126 [Grifola frondosa]
MLAAASGRVVVMIGSGYEPASMLEGCTQSVALQLSQELDPLGIKVSSVLCGPSTTNFHRPQEFSLSDASQSRIESVSSTAASARTEHIRSIRNAIEEALRYFPVHSEDVTHVLREITKSSYPKYKYIIGIHPFLHLVQNATPTVLRLCVTSLRHHLS